MPSSTMISNRATIYPPPFINSWTPCFILWSEASRMSRLLLKTLLTFPATWTQNKSSTSHPEKTGTTATVANRHPHPSPADNVPTNCRQKNRTGKETTCFVWPRRGLNTQTFDLESTALPLRYEASLKVLHYLALSPNRRCFDSYFSVNLTWAIINAWRPLFSHLRLHKRLELCYTVKVQFFLD